MEMGQDRGRVWVLEDSALEAEMARRALSASQDVFLFDDGSVVLEKIATGAIPDVLVLDSQLVGVSGLEVCRVVRETHGPIALPILMLTAQGEKQDVIEALHAGANDYVTKPYHVAELVARVGTLVNTSRLAATQASRTRQLALGADVGAALTEGRGLAEISRRAADAICRHLDAPVVEVWTQSGAELALTASSRSRDDVVLPMELVHAVAQSARPEASHVAGGNFAAVPLVVRGEVLGVLAVATRAADIAESLGTVANLLALGLFRARAEEERLVLLDRERNARAEAEAANRSKDDFLAMVSHELRTPLNAITGWTSMLLSGGLDPARTRRAYEPIDRNARAQVQLIDDLLDIGRITSGRLRLSEGSVDVAAVAEMALESVRVTADGRGVLIDSRIDAQAGHITGDVHRIQQIIWNLLSNPNKFTPKGGLVTLSVAREPNRIVIQVRDTGQGITPEFLPHVFERFKQADTSVTRTRGGLGLGLAIVRHLVELHGGTIDAESEGLGKGALFTVVLPIDASKRSRGDGLMQAGKSIPLDRPREIEGLRVLVVDDEPDARDLLRTLLESCNIDVKTASSAAEAMDAIKEAAPDVVLSDIAMPEEDGISFIRRIRSLSRDDGGRIPAVALTAYARLEDRMRALRAGFNAHVAKPVDPNELLAVLSSLTIAR